MVGVIVAVSSIYELSVTDSQLLSIPTMHVSGKLDRNFRHFISAKEYLQQLKQMEGSISSCIRCIFLAFEDIQSNPSLPAPRYY